MSIEQRATRPATWGTTGFTLDGPSIAHAEWMTNHGWAQCFTFQNGSETVVAIYPNGTVVLSKGVTPDEAARTFWDAVEALGLADVTRAKLGRWEDLGRRIDTDMSIPGWISDEIQNLLK